MKKLITANDIRKAFNDKEKCIYVDDNTIITPAAKDCAHELGVEILEGQEVAAAVAVQAQVQPEKIESEVTMESIVMKEVSSSGLSISEELISRIVNEVVSRFELSVVKPEIKKECDPSGIRLVHGESVTLDKLDTGNPKDKVGIKEILSRQECPNMATGFMELEKSSFDWTLGYDELDYIIEGTLDITIDGKTYTGKAGDVFFIPKDSSITFTASEYCKFFFSTYPANWEELSNN